jgi:hypothetical protein
VSCRRDYRDLSQAEKDRFVAALYFVKANGKVDEFADLHDVHFSHGHRNSGFLPWHREFIRLFELELQAYDPRVRLPYWFSPTDNDPNGPLWANSFLGQFDAAWNLGRDLGASGSLPGTGAVDTALNEGTYLGFRPDLESNVHDPPHNWVGGQMATSRSPRDPVFYLHHTYIDMCFAQWQMRHPGEPYAADAGSFGFNDSMHPWMTRVSDIWDHRPINMYAFPVGWMQDAPRVMPPPTAPPAVTFPAVPAGLTFLRAADFEADACDPLTFTVGVPVVDAGAPAGTNFQRMSAPSFTVDPHVDHTARIWVAYTGTAAGDTATGHIDVSCVETGDSWVVPLSATTIPKPRAAMALVLDQSNSMNFDSGIGPGITRADVLRFSAPPAVQVVDDDHALLVTTFDHDAHPQLGLTVADAAGRLLISNAIGNYAPNPNGWTAIGEALKSAHDQLDPVTGYDIKATVLLTDGQENHGPNTRLAIEDVAASITEHTFAIGLGVPGELDPQRLMALCNNTSGYMLITGALDGDAIFRLAKFYQQIVAGVTNHEIVLDPDGWAQPGVITRIPFRLTESDILARAVLLTPNPWALQMAIEAPDGEIVTEATASPMVEWRTASGLRMSRVSLPLPVAAGDAHEGEWAVLLAHGRGGDRLSAVQMSSWASQQAIRYNVMVEAYSNLAMRAGLSQDSNEPGAHVALSVSLREYDQPLDRPAWVRAEITRPDNTAVTVALGSVGGGRYEGSITALDAGVYLVRFRADGVTSRGRAFTRERLRTAAVWAGGDQPPRPPSPPRDPGDRVCELIDCLLGQRGVERALERLELDPDVLRKCVSAVCRDHQAHRSDPIPR